MIELPLTKRMARFKNEWGLFPDSPVADEEFRLITQNHGVLAKVSSPKNLESLKYIWALATMVADATDGINDKDEAMEFLCVKARHMTMKLDPHSGKMELARKSLSRISNENLHRLIDRMVYIVLSEILPGMKESDLRKEIERMVA